VTFPTVLDTLEPGELVTLASGLALSVLDRGPRNDAVPFLLVHGLASNKYLWDGVANELTRASRRSIAVDLRGHGHSAKPDDHYDFTSIVGDITQLLDALGILRVHIVGQSWGGNVVIEAGATIGDRIATVACVDGGFIELSGEFSTWDDCREKLQPPKLIGTKFSQMEAWIRNASPDWPESGIVGQLAFVDVRDDGTIAPWLTIDRHLQILRALYDHRPSKRFPLIDAPTLLVPAGSVARFASDKAALVEAAVALLPHGSAHWFDGADHDIHAQYPEQLASLLLTHSERISS
jgi:pimeloyl-ACP methyl ester carboxylesterase